MINDNITLQHDGAGRFRKPVQQSGDNVDEEIKAELI